MDKDLLRNPYGRFHNIAYYLAAFGHQVTLILISYKRNENETIERNGLTVNSISLIPDPIKAFYKIRKIIEEIQADWIFGCSDTYYGILATYFARRFKSKSLIDAYDNYEAYTPFFKPVHWLWRNALRKADLVTCAGPSLEKLFYQYRKSRIEILPMTADEESFYPMDKVKSRESLNLPIHKILIGYHGAISHTREITLLFNAVKQLQLGHHEVTLVMSGRLSRDVEIPKFAKYLGYLPESEIAKFVNSMDVLAVPNKHSKFGHYSYPVKLYEAMACGVPIVATKTKSTQWILREQPSFLVEPGNINEFAECLKKSLNFGRVNYGPLPQWKNIVRDLDEILRL